MNQDEGVFYAIQADDSVQLSYHIDDGADVNMTFLSHDPVLKTQYSILHMCCQKGHYDCAKCLIDNGAYKEVTDIWGHTPIFFCVCCEWLSLVDLFIKSGCNLEAKDKDSMTPLIRSVKCSTTEVMEQLISGGANLDAVDGQNRSALWHAAATAGKIDFLKCLLHYGANINCADAREKLTPLQAAVMRAHKDQDLYIDILLKHGASVNARRDTAPSPIQTVLIRGWNRGITASEDDLRLIQLFIMKGCNVDHVRIGNVRPYLKGTALKMAAHRGCVDVVKILLEAGASPNLTESLSISPLLIAASEGHIAVVCQLAMYNASLDMVGYLKINASVQRINPFEVALKKGHLDGARLLILAGYNLCNEPYLSTCENIPDALQLNPEFWCWIQEFRYRPLPLLQLARRQLRQVLGCPLNKKLDKISGLPRYFRNYLLMLELESDL